MYSNARTPQKQQGVAIVEFVIALPLCLLLIFAAAEFGRAFLQYNTLTQSIQDGVRYLASRASVGTTGAINITPELEAEVRNLVVFGNTVGAGSPVLPGLAPGDVMVQNDGFGRVRVEVNYAYNSIFFSIPRFVSAGQIDVSGYVFRTASTMRAL